MNIVYMEVYLAALLLLCRIDQNTGKKRKGFQDRGRNDGTDTGRSGCSLENRTGCNRKGSGGCQGGSDQTESKLISDLLKKYDELVRPAQKARQNVTVHFSLALNQIIALDDTSGQLDSRVTLRMWWKDFRLAWDPEDYGGIDRVYLPTKKVWVPDVDLYNGYDHEVKRDIKVTVFNEGEVLWMPVATYQSTCSHEFRSDSWHCPLLFRSWTMTGDQLDLKPFQGETDVDLRESMGNPSWKVISGEGARVPKEYACCLKNTPIPTMEYVLNVRNTIGSIYLGKRRKRNANYLRSSLNRLSMDDDL